MIVKIQRISLFLLCFLLFFPLIEKSHAEQYGPVKNGDTLWPIAGKIRPDKSISLHQMVIALLKENPTAFRNSCNFNTLKIGKTLTIPPLAKINAIGQAEAVAEFNRQNEQWRNRQQGMTCSALLEQGTQPTENVEETTKAILTTEKDKTAVAPVEKPSVASESALPVKEGTTETTTESPDKTTGKPPQAEQSVVKSEAEEAKIAVTEKPPISAETGESVALPTEEVANIDADPTNGSSTEETHVGEEEAITSSEAVDVPPKATDTPAEPTKITKSIEEKTGFSVITVAAAVLIALLILGLLAWLAFREKANKSSLRKKTEHAVLSNQYDKMNDDDKAGDTDAGLDLFAETFTETTERHRT